MTLLEKKQLLQELIQAEGNLKKLIMYVVLQAIVNLPEDKVDEALLILNSDG